MDTISRKEAKERGLTKYFTGKECKHSHVAERQSANGQCDECVRIWRDANSERLKQWYQDNKERYKEYDTYRRKDNLERYAALEAKRRAMKLNATPSWYEHDLVLNLYTKSKHLSDLWGITIQVDHIVPLQSSKVCGLHCWDNLQLLDSSLNQKKGNSF